MSAFIIVEWALSAFEESVPERCSAEREKNTTQSSEATVHVTAFIFGF